MMDGHTLKLSPRKVVGKKVKQLRNQGILPVHVYGAGIEAHSLQGDLREIRRLLAQVGTNIPVSVEIQGEGGENICFVREVQRHPVTEDVLHVDFVRVDVSMATRAEVPITLVGEAPAVRQGGSLLQYLQDLFVEALPMDVPASIEVDVSGLDEFDKAVYVSDITVGNRVTVLSEPEEMIARVIPPRVEEVFEEEVEEEEELEGVEEGEEAEAEAGEEGEAEESEEE